MTEQTKGIIAIVTTCTVWALSLMYYDLLAHVSPIEVLAHRTFWSMVLLVLIVAGQRRLGQLVALLRAAPGRIGLAALAISGNWFLFILSVQIGRATESSIGYYIYPLIAVLMGRFILGEALSRGKWVAVALAAIAVVVLTVGLGIIPSISICLALSFAIYGLIKKNLAAGPMLSVAAEVVLIAPIAAGWLVAVHVLGYGGVFVDSQVAVFGSGWRDSLLLAGAGPLTALPLMMFSYAAKRVNMSTLGVVFYWNPTLQFLIAVLILGEPFGTVHAVAFPMIWAAVLIYSVLSVSEDRAARNLSASSGIVSTTSTNSRSDESANPKSTI